LNAAAFFSLTLIGDLPHAREIPAVEPPPEGGHRRRIDFTCRTLLRSATTFDSDERRQGGGHRNTLLRLFQHLLVRHACRVRDQCIVAEGGDQAEAIAVTAAQRRLTKEL